MIIVLEGPDLAGKSTIAQNLLKYFGEVKGRNVGIIKTSQPDTESPIALFTEYVSQLYQAYSLTVDQPGTIRIFDRLHVGEWVYGPRKRANSQLSWSQLTAIDDMLDSIGAIKVFVDQPNTKLLERYDRRGEEFVSKPELLEIAGHYRQLLDPFSKEAANTHEPSLTRWHRISRVNDLGGLLA